MGVLSGRVKFQGWASGLNSSRFFRRVPAGVLLSIPVLAGVLASSQVCAQANTEAPPANTESGGAQTDAGNASDQPTPAKTPEAPIEVTSKARPSLDYEPSESISEDRSVSFPVDI